MRPIFVVLVIVAMAIAGLTGVLINRFVAEQKVQVQSVQQPVAPATEDVLVAAVDLKPGAIIKADDLRYQSWPVTATDSRLVRHGNGDAKAAFVGTIVRRPFLAGEPMSPEAVFRQDESGVMAGLLSPGMRAISINVSLTGSVSGFVLPNDRVDILLNADIRTFATSQDAPDHGEGHFFISEVVLSNVRVIAVDDKTVRPEGAATLAGKTVTVEVSPKDAEILLTAGRIGELSLTLRAIAPSEAGDAPPTGFTTHVDASRAVQAILGIGPGGLRGGGRPVVAPKNPTTSTLDVRVNRAGSTTTQSFAN
jgi:pilus assembly protein CpaB